MDSSRIFAGDVTDFAQGINAVSGVVTVSNSSVEVDAAPSLTALVTGSTIGARLAVHHSRIIVGTGSSTPLTARRGPNSSLRIYTSLANSPSQGSPTCILSYHFTGTLTSGCAHAP